MCSSDLRTQINEYDLLEGTRESNSLFSREETQLVEQHDVSFSIDPGPTHLSFAHASVSNDVMKRGIVAFTSLKTIENLRPILGTSTQLFTMYLSPDGNEKSDANDDNRHVVEKALTYRPMPQSVPSDIEFFDANTKEASRQFHHYLVEKKPKPEEVGQGELS